MNTARDSASARTDEHIDDVDAHHLPQQDVLIQPWSSTDNRLSSKPADPVLSAAHQRQQPSSYPTPAIHPPQNTFTSNTGQDVPYTLSVDSGPHYSSFHRNDQLRTLASPALPSRPSTFHNGSINTTNYRPRTTLPVFGTTSTLAAHYGIPTRLPPIPQVSANSSNSNSNNTRPPVPRFQESAPSTSTSINHQYQQSVSDALIGYQHMCAQYLEMTNGNPDENGPVPYSPAGAAAHLEPPAEEAAQSISNMLFGSVNDFTSPLWDEYLTSPFLDETPCEPYLETPDAPSMADFFQSPAVVGLNLDPNFADLPLVAREPTFTKTIETVASVPPSSGMDSGSASPEKGLNFEDMYTMSPTSPALEPLSTQTSPLISDVTAGPSNKKTTGRKKIPTGTRKNVTPDSLIPIDAPTQARNYQAPSTTSRKAVPAVFARKRARSAAFGLDEEDELAGSEGGGDGPLNPTEAAAIEAKRRQNTLAARRSRKRKLEYQRELEEGLEAIRRERDMWKERAMLVRTLLIQHGQQDPFMNLSM